MKELEEEIAALLAKAEDADWAPLEDGLRIPDEVTRRQERRAKLAQRPAPRWRRGLTHGRKPSAPSMKRSWHGAKRSRSKEKSRVDRIQNLRAPSPKPKIR